MSDQLKLEHQRVSLEMSNPFTQIGAYAQKRLSGFMRQTTAEAVSIVSGLTSSQAAKATGTIPAGAVQNQAKNYTYSDVARIEVFVPSTLKQKVTLDSYAAVVLKQIEIASEIVDYAGQEIVDTLNKYISLPNRLGDLTTTDNEDVATADVMKRIAALKPEFEKMTNASGTQTQRPYSEVFRRNLDYVKAMQDTRTIEQKLNELINKLPAFKKIMEDAAQASNKLMSLVESKPEQYSLGNVAATRLSNLMFSFAQEAEYVGATITNCRVLIKAMADNHVIIEKATERFK